ncbi:probable inactive ATP-dependent zinc metalloprotease FTSHI 5, chloroplastic [Olea europaea var. sylvestris]|uniref:probable inactive ATP-dependent zinc metalloprotease FTSHI 5, chloroplastic n=1 Tax=Olea europaea var. sylvestris TaxID=158386 RepID=UPI000C1D24C7|nr:probable inactive ATP-dependent zinc metalloprotease FTSHI 5, chloroplastic [Olea europaea var. sylvestris]
MMLQKNRLVLEKIVEELLQYEILTGRDLERIIADNGGIREREPFFLSSTSAEEAVVSRLLDEKSSGTALLNAAN